MSKLRIYELAKELGVDNKALIARAQELGMKDKSSHSNSLTDSEADILRREFLRSAVSSDTERTLSTSIDQEGRKSQVVERRTGSVIRRRRTVVDEKEAEAPEPVEEVTPEVEEPVEAASEAEEPAPAEEEPKKKEEEKDEKGGPKVLGKIKLSLRRKEQPKEKEQKESKDSQGPKKLTKFKNVTPPAADPEEADSGDKADSKKKKKKKRRVVEFSRGDLVDYDTRPRKTGTAKAQKDEEREEEVKEEKAVAAPKAAKRVIKMSKDHITVGELAAQMSLKAGQVITKLMELGVMATINQQIDQDTATIVADELDFTIEYAGFDESDLIKIEGIDDPEQMKPRSPVVTVMGHVDHGKTSLLDYIRKTSVTTKEHGGITQHIGAYVVDMHDNKSITFIDTPGHAAFTEMRSRGADITDIVILVVAADDGVMPQTLEALNHAKAAEVPIIVAVNKMDKPDANPDKVKTQLAEHGLQPEDWGGDTMFMPVSALNGQGVEDLLESVLLVADVQELTANPTCRVKGTVIEVRQEQGLGTVCTVLVQAGTLKIGDIFLVGANFGRVRSMVDHTLKKMEVAPPSTPVEITGFNGTPEAGDDFIVMDSEAVAKEVATHRMEKQRELHQLELSGGPVSLEEFAKQAAELDRLELRIIVKADVGGSLEAVKQAIADLTHEEVAVKVLHSAVGGITESDIQLAVASQAIIVGFNVRGEPRALQMAESQGIEVRFYRVIYELIDDVKKAMGGLLAPVEEEISLARAEVRDTFSVPKIGTVAGCYVTDGKVERGASVRLLRDNVVVYEGQMHTLRRFKDDVKEVQSGYECGMSIDGYNDIKIGDVIEVYKIKHIQRTLE